MKLVYIISIPGQITDATGSYTTSVYFTNTITAVFAIGFVFIVIFNKRRQTAAANDKVSIHEDCL